MELDYVSFIKNDNLLEMENKWCRE